jgi:hypothetical protein
MRNGGNYMAQQQKFAAMLIQPGPRTAVPPALLDCDDSMKSSSEALRHQRFRYLYRMPG